MLRLCLFFPCLSLVMLIKRMLVKKLRVLRRPELKVGAVQDDRVDKPHDRLGREENDVEPLVVHTRRVEGDNGSQVVQPLTPSSGKGTHSLPGNTLLLTPTNNIPIAYEETKWNRPANEMREVPDD